MSFFGQLESFKSRGGSGKRWTFKKYEFDTNQDWIKGEGIKIDSNIQTNCFFFISKDKNIVTNQGILKKYFLIKIYIKIIFFTNISKLFKNIKILIFFR